jgi:hypothetical protein
VAGRALAVNGVREGSTAGFVGCTACTISHLPRARVAAQSWREHHPEAPFFVLLIDGDDWPSDGEHFDVVLPEELGLSSEELALQRGIYDAYELSCALKPPFIRRLLERGESAVVFTDPDVCFYGSVDDLAAAAARAGLALTPMESRPARTRRYFPLSQVEHREITNGLFNGGLLAVGRGGSEFLGWWGGWLARDALREATAGIWTDQSWIDWALVYFEHVVVRDSSLNVGFWNLDERELGGTEAEPTVDGAPLRHFHFAGFDPRRAELLSTYREDDTRFVHRNWPPTPPSPILAHLLEQYRDRLLECGSEELRDHRYTYDVGAGGRALELRERATYREAVLASEAVDGDPPPNPFDASRVDDFGRLIDDPSSLRRLSPEARSRLERLRRPGLSVSSLGRVTRRLLPAIRYAVSERAPPSLDLPARVASDVVLREY